MAKVVGTQRIVSTPGTCFGRPRIVGTRVPVRNVVALFMGGRSFVECAEQYGIAVDDAEEAVRYAMLHGRRGL